MGLFSELQKRIPDRWFFRRLLPATLFVIVAIVGGGQLGQRHWHDTALARERIADTIRLGDGTSANAIASLVLLVIAIAGAALVVPFVANSVDLLASGGWPWWLVPVGERLRKVRARNWSPPDDLGKAAVRARAAGRHYRAARLEQRKHTTTEAAPATPTWSGDRLAATRSRIKDRTGLDPVTDWTAVSLALPDPARTALTNARESYDSACEAIVWAIAFVVLSAWWWPAVIIGLLIWLAGWRWLRRAVGSLSETAEAVFALYQSTHH